MQTYYNLEKLKELRKAAKLTLNAIAEKVGVSHRNIQLWFHGKHRGSRNTTTLQKIVEVLDGNINEILTTVNLPTQDHQTKIENENNENNENKKKGGVMIETKAVEYFKFQKPPFAGGRIDENEFIKNESTQKFESIIEMAVFNNSFLCLAGATGSGKSTLVEKVIDDLKTKNKLKVLQFSTLQPEIIDRPYILREILEQFDQTVPKTIRIMEKRVISILNDLRKHNNKLILIFDEAHRLQYKTLIACKQFWEGMGIHTGKLTLILVGLPAIIGNLAVNKEVNNRVNVVTLNPITRKTDIITNYIDKKLNFAGGRVDIFTPDAIQNIAGRVESFQDVNNIATRAINNAAEMGENTITSELIELV